MQPTLFLSHGSPMTALMDSPARDFLAGLGAALPERPSAILVISAHWETDIPTLNAVARNETIHDFFGFPRPLYNLQYPAPGAPQLAARIAELLDAAGHKSKLDPSRGLDHGAWVPLLLAYPQADIPVVQLSVQSHLGPAHHAAIGALLAPLRAENILIIGSGSFTHDLRRFRASRNFSAPETQDVTDFSSWMDAHITTGDLTSLLDYRRLAPHAADQHPTEEHLLPLYSALAAAGPAPTPTRLHHSVEFGFLRMDSYAFQ